MSAVSNPNRDTPLREQELLKEVAMMSRDLQILYRQLAAAKRELEARREVGKQLVMTAELFVSDSRFVCDPKDRKLYLEHLKADCEAWNAIPTETFK